MKNRVRSISTTLLASALLAGCSGTQQLDEPVADAATAENGDAQTTQAFMFESGALEIGDFDPYALGDDLFDPCTEISPAEFAAAGFENVEPMPEELKGIFPARSACQIYQPSIGPEVILSSNDANFAHINETTAVFTEPGNGKVPGMFTYGPKSGVGDSCWAQIDTTRGAIAILASLEDSSEANCALATSYMKLYFNALQRDAH